MVGGGALALVGFVLWEEASSVEGDIHKAPLRTSADLAHVRDLESKGDSYALWGNVSVIAGVAVAGVSGYLFWRDRRHHSGAQAQLVPMIIDHGVAIGLVGAR